MKSLWISLALIAALFVAGNLPISAQSPEQLYQKGLMKEEGEGLLQDAIDLYSQIADNGNADHSLRAKALLHIGMCYEKMGTQEAVKAYQQLVTKFPSQKNEVAIARERLNRLLVVAENIQPSVPVPEFTKVPIPTKLSWSVRLSPDGKKLGLVSEEKIFIMPLSGNMGPGIPGAPVELNTEGIDVEYTDLSWSHDGNWIAFNDLATKDSSQRIYVVPLKGGKPEKIVENYRGARIVNYRISLSPDGKTVAFSSIKDNQQHLFTTPVDGGKASQLTDMQAREPAYSPDGRYIAYVEDKELGSGQGDLGLWVIPSQGGTPHRLADAGAAASPVWSPDGNMIAFLDYSRGGQFYSGSINIVPFSTEGNSTGKVARIDIPENIGEVRMLAGWTPDNRIGALCMTKQVFALYTLPSKGGQAAKILNDCYALQPRWSPDGKQILYTTPPQEGENRFRRLFVASVPAVGGTGKPLPNNPNSEPVRPISYQGGNRISPDGKWIVSAGYTPEDINDEIEFPLTKIWKIAIDGSDSKQITHAEGTFADFCPSWSPDGTKIGFVRTQLKTGMDPFGGESVFYIVNSSGGEPEKLISMKGTYISSPVWSPDGTMIAYLTGKAPTRSDPALNVVNVKSGESRIVGKVPRANVNIELAWSPDSKQIAFNGEDIHVMNIEDGSIEDIETNLVDTQIWHLDWSPDGEHFVFAGGKGGNDEFWFLDNFLPLENLRQQKTEFADESKGIRIKQIWKQPYLDFLGSVSLDGSLLSYVYWGEGDVAVHNLKTGKDKVLIYEADLEGNPQGFAQSPKISKDGRQIAYYWWRPNHTFDLRLTDVNNPSSRCIYKEEGVEVYPSTWLSDQELVTIRQNRNTEMTSISLFNMNDGTYRDLKTFTGRKWCDIAASPDEKYLAYDYTDVYEGGNSDIILLPVNGGSEIPLINHPSNDKVLGWDPENKAFLFISDRSGNWDLWALPMDSGKPGGTAKRVYSDIGDVEPLGFTESGDLYFGFSKRYFSSSLLPFDTGTGEILKGSGETIEGSNFLLQWSPDGNYLAYIREDRNSDNPWQLIVRDTKSGAEREFSPNLLPGSFCWSPDGKSILLSGRERSKVNTEGYEGGIFLLNTKTGKIDEILSLSDYEFIPSDDDAPPLSTLAWAPDGQSFYMLFFRDRLIKHDLKTGKDEVIYKHPRFQEYILQVSPDGNSLLLGTQDQGKKSRLFTIPAKGGDEVELCRVQEANSFVSACWSPDGKYIYFIERADETCLWRIPSTGGKPQKLKTWDNWTDVYGINPDMNQIAISQRVRTTEVREVENLSGELDEIFKE